MECICPILPPCLISEMCIYRGKNGNTLSRQGWWGVYCAAKGSRQRSACWWGKPERGYIRVKRSAELFARRLNGDLAQIGREGLASKYLRQGGGQKLRVGWLTVKLRNPVAGRCWSRACRVFRTRWQRQLWIGFRWNERVGEWDLPPPCVMASCPRGAGKSICVTAQGGRLRLERCAPGILVGFLCVSPCGTKAGEEVFRCTLVKETLLYCGRGRFEAIRCR